LQIILLPRLATKELSSKKRHLAKKAKRPLLAYRHADLRARVHYNARMAGKAALDAQECYSTKTCLECGHGNYKVGGSRRFVCRFCGYEAHRWVRFFGLCCGVVFLLTFPLINSDLKSSDVILIQNGDLTVEVPPAPAATH